MNTMLILGIFFCGACIPLSRLVLNYIKRSSKYSEDFKLKMSTYQSIFNIACIVIMLVFCFILKSSY